MAEYVLAVLFEVVFYLDWFSGKCVGYYLDNKGVPVFKRGFDDLVVVMLDIDRYSAKSHAPGTGGFEVAVASPLVFAWLSF